MTAAAASTKDTFRAVTRILGPLLAQGPVIRRPAMTAAAARWHWDRNAGQLLADLRDRYGDGPLPLRIPGRRIALVLSREDVGRVLQESPEPFSAATREKRAALGHFQPHGVLISSGEVRQRRRGFNEQVLDMGQELHRLAGPITEVIEDEVRSLLGHRTGIVTWPPFGAMFARVVRRIVLGESAAADRGFTQRLAHLRRRGNWAYAAGHDKSAMRDLRRALHKYLTAAQPGSLAGIIAATSAGHDVDPYGQVPHWLFAFDALGATVLRALALLSVDRGAAADVAPELTTGVAYRPRLTATVLDTVRLWPTTLVVLRETTRETTWAAGRVLSPRTTLVIVSSFFHRDPRHVSAADRLDLASWLDGTFDQDPGIVPFSAGPVRCPGRDLVTFTGATMLAAVLHRHGAALVTPRLHPDHLPHELDHFGIALGVRPRSSGRDDSAASLTREG